MTQVVETKQVNITIEQGASFWMPFVVRDDDDNLVSLVGATIVAQLREYAEASDYLQFTATHNGSGGRVTITMPHEETANIPYTSGVYDVFIYYANGTRDKCIEGDVTITPAVTKPVAGEIIYLLSFAKEEDFPNTGMVRRIYFSHATNHMYRWNGTAYVSITTDGEAATVEVGTVTTLDPGEDATVENVGSLTNAVFDFGIPKGEKGDPGTTTWEGITNKPETFPPSAHNHDDRYYTAEETNNLLNTKQDTLTFDSAPTVNSGNPVTSGGVHTALSGKANSTHSHGSLYGPNGQVTGGNAIANGDYPLIADASNSNKLCYGSSAQFDGETTTKALSQKGTFESFAKPGDSYTTAEEDALLLLKANSADLGDLAFEDDAPSDNKQYARKNGQWAEVQGGSGGGSWGSITGTLSDQTDLQQALDAKADIIKASASGSVVSITDGAPYAVDALSVTIEPVQSGSGDPSPDNVRPITGHSSATVTRTGENLIDISKGVFASNIMNWGGGNGVTDGTFSLPAGTYTVSGNGNFDGIYVFDDTGTRIGIAYNKSFYTFTTTQYHDILISLYKASSTAETFASMDIQLELGSTATAYQPYQGTSVTISLGSTIYGGTLDVKTGTLTVPDDNIPSYNGETLPSTWISDRDVYSAGATPTIGAQVVYKLADPQTVTLSPETLSTLLGSNVLWADTGDTSVTYRADTKLYIDRKISESATLTRAMIADSATADGKAPKSLSTGDLIIVGDELRKATANIGSGSAITASNSTIATLADVIKALQ